MVQEIVVEEFVVYSVEDQVVKVTYIGSSSVLLEEMSIYQYSFSYGKITMWILVIKFINYDVVL